MLGLLSRLTKLVGRLLGLLRRCVGLLRRCVGPLALLSPVLRRLPWSRLLMLCRGMLSLVGLTGLRGVLALRVRLRDRRVLSLRPRSSMLWTRLSGMRWL